MKAEIYWILQQEHSHLAIMPRPRGGEWLSDEIRSLAEGGVDVLVSLLTRDEVRMLELQQEESECRKAGIRFRSYPIPDRTVPADVGEFQQFIGELSQWVRQTTRVAVHCRAGIGRSSLVAAAVLNCSGIPLDDAWHRIAQVRGVEVPDTAEQRRWLTTICAELRSQSGS